MPIRLIEEVFHRRWKLWLLLTAEVAHHDWRVLRLSQRGALTAYLAIDDLWLEFFLLRL